MREAEYWATLPQWFWIIFYSLLLMVLVIAIYNLVQKILVKSSIATIIITISIPLVGIVNSIGRYEGLNEFQYFKKALLEGSAWSIYIALANIYVLLWLVYVSLKKKKR